MKRIILFMMSAILAGIPIFTASAETISLHENLALALQSADISDSDGTALTALIVSEDESSDVVSVSLMRGEDEISADEAASINFDGANLDGLTSGDFESFDVFTGLEELRIALPDSFSGEFLPSFDKLSVLDVSGSTADFILSLYKSVNVVSVDAGNCSHLKAVNLALVRSETVSSDSGSDTSGIASMFSGQTKSELLSSPLSSLASLNLSNNPELDRVGYAFDAGSSSMFGGISSLFGGGGSSIPKGYKTHTVITALRKDTVYLNSDMSHSNSSGFNITAMIGGGSSDEITAYTGESVNLVPALRTLNLNGSGISDEDYISVIDIPEMGALVSGDFSGMTALEYITLPSGNTLRSLNLTGDTGLLALDLSGTRGFTWPEGFQTLTGLRDFRMAGRSEIDSVDVSRFTRLVSLDMSNDSLSAIDLHANSLLENLYLGSNYIYSLDLDAFTTLKNIDVRNNRLVKINLSKNLGIRINYNSPNNAAASLSPQTRNITGNRSTVFSFRDIGLSSLEYANIAPESVKGEGVSITEYDPLSGTVKFSALPSVITYDYMTGIYYEGDTRPVCMNVRLVRDVSGNPPSLTPKASHITGKAKAGAVTPVTITADSESPVTWSTTPETLPAGLVKASTGWTLTISGEPSDGYSGTVTITARNENGVSDSATVTIDIEEADKYKPVLSPLTAKIIGRVNGGMVNPVVITAEGDSPVTWTTIPEEMPAGLVKTPGTWTLVISGEPDRVYSGTVIITASNEYGVSAPATVSIDIGEAASVGGSSGGCYAGSFSIAVGVLAVVIMSRKR